MEGKQEKSSAATTTPITSRSSKDSATSTTNTAIAGVLLRSKGFMWMASSKSAAYFMSHAGQYLEVTALGRWWHDMAPSDWPQGMEADILQEFNLNKEILDSFTSTRTSNSSSVVDMLQTIANNSAHGDRRIELVFIGQFNEPNAATDKAYSTFEKLLDSCLLTDTEMQEYCDITDSTTNLNEDVNSLLRDKFVGGPRKEDGEPN
jgi:G3E family GTPase